jgi:ankyrin repeat protein
LIKLVKDFQKLNADFANALLTVAMILGNATMVNEILSLNYAFEWENGNILGFSPLQYAIFLGEVNYLKALLGFEGVDVNFFDYKGRTLLMLAVLEKNPSMVQLLLAQRDIELGCTDEDKKTILNYVEESENEEIISLLNSFIESAE